MSAPAEIAATAGVISAQLAAVAETGRGMSVLKGSIDFQELVSQELVQLIQQAATGLGTNIDVTA
jgi:hypothetical protein